IVQATAGKLVVPNNCCKPGKYTPATVNPTPPSEAPTNHKFSQGREVQIERVNDRQENTYNRVLILKVAKATVCAAESPKAPRVSPNRVKVTSAVAPEITPVSVTNRELIN